MKASKRNLAGLMLSALLLAGLALAQTAPKDVLILKGSPMGGVKFLHKMHTEQTKCTTCHHPSKSEKPSKVATEACRDCHTTPPTAPMKTKTQAAFHNPSATSGVCIDCHKEQNAKGKNAPTKCMQCHQKANT
jgi:hypothetical protein